MLLLQTLLVTIMCVCVCVLRRIGCGGRIQEEEHLHCYSSWISRDDLPAGIGSLGDMRDIIRRNKNLFL